MQRRGMGREKCEMCAGQKKAGPEGPAEGASVGGFQRTVTIITVLYDAWPKASTALTRKKYLVPLIRPVTLAVVDFAATVTAAWKALLIRSSTTNCTSVEELSRQLTCTTPPPSAEAEVMWGAVGGGVPTGVEAVATLL